MNPYDVLTDGKFIYIMDMFEGTFDKPYIYLWDEENRTIIHEVGRKNSDEPFDTSNKRFIGNLEELGDLIPLKTKG